MSPNCSVDDSARLREFQEFLDAAVHGLRAPIRGIGTSAGLLLQKWNAHLDEDAQGCLRSILDGVSGLNQLTKCLGDYSMSLLLNPGAVLLLPVENAVQSALTGLRDRIEETEASVYLGHLPRLRADHGQFALLFACLLTNALEFRTEGVAPRIEITATAAGEEWRFAVSDNGIGIAPRFHRQIFEPFERLHAGRHGFGLGLAIARKVVSAHGGRLWVDSQEAEGSTFFFTIPRETPSTS